LENIRNFSSRSFQINPWKNEKIIISTYEIKTKIGNKREINYFKTKRRIKHSSRDTQNFFQKKS
jgi:hypothetical protein